MQLIKSKSDNLNVMWSFLLPWLQLALNFHIAGLNLEFLVSIYNCRLGSELMVKMGVVLFPCGILGVGLYYCSLGCGLEELYGVDLDSGVCLGI